MLTSNILDLRRRASQFLSSQSADRREILNEDGERICTARDEQTAALMVELHNSWLPLANGWLMVHRSLKDRRLLTQLFASEAGL